jgi:DNA-binding GntR family transcriptional regulator
MSTLKISKVVKRSIEAQAVDALRESILSGAIKPGSRVTEIQISEQMDLSRATVRAALHQLAREGLTTLVPYTGWTIISLTPKDVWELYTLRSSVERLAAQLVASTIDEKKSKHLKQCFDKLVSACETAKEDRIAEADFALHKAIISLAGHGRLQQQYEVIEQQIRIYIRSSDALIHEPGTIVDQHRPIVEAILAGDAESAGRFSEQHNMTEGEKLTAHLMHLGPEDNVDVSRDKSTGRLKNLKTRREAAA